MGHPFMSIECCQTFLCSCAFWPLTKKKPLPGTEVEEVLRQCRESGRFFCYVC